MALFSKKSKSAISTKSSSENNPYLNARAEWLERYGSYIARAKNWRLAAFGCILITALSITGNVIQATQYKVIPYVVEIDRLGQAQGAGPATNVIEAPQRLIQAEIATFIDNWRTVTPDMDLQRKKIIRLSHFLRGAAKGEVREWFDSNNPYARAKEGRLVQVDVKGLPLPVTANSWRVEWKETIRSHQGMLLDETRYEATVSIKVEIPTQETQIINNPGGIYITDVSATKVIESDGSGKKESKENTQGKGE